MKISEVSKQARIAISTIRYYEKNKLIPKKYIFRDELNYRIFSEEVVDYLKDVKLLLSSGFSINELGCILENSKTLDKTSRETIIKKKIIDLTEKQDQLIKAKEILNDILEGREVIRDKSNWNCE